MGILLLLGAFSLVIWLGILFHPACPWDFQPVGDDGEPLPGPQTWPCVRVLVPARNESTSLPHTLVALLRQDYPGDFMVILIDDRSEDNTAAIAQKLAEEARAVDRLSVISGAALPQGWVGKVWALAQGAAHCGLRIADYGLGNEEGPSLPKSKPQYFLLTDADIYHTPGSLRRLVAESERGHLALNSRMARLRCVSKAERLLIPPFVFFFNLLYPMRQVNDQHSTVAAAAGGCVLVAVEELERAGGFSCIKDRLIDDVSLARQIKALGVPIRLSLSRFEVKSLRTYETLSTIWVMVRRTAFTELRYSWLRLIGTIVGMLLLFVLPPLSLIGGIGATAAILEGRLTLPVPWTALLAFAGFYAWATMAIVYGPAVRFFELSGLRCWTLPLAGILYGAMTLDSAFRHLTGRRIGWREH